MKTDQIRDSYLDFFKSKKHTAVSSDSLVPQNDPTLLFTGAGMNQFKEYFLGLKKDLKRAASSQKCLRTADLDEVGRTPYHHSFFEMLGNFSFGDYFKEEAIAWAWEFLTEHLKIPKERLRVTVHEKDDEAYNIWRDKIKIRQDWIYRCGDKSNFWPSNAPKDGPNGPCGPCSEIYFDQDPKSSNEDIASSRFAEIWNLVFTQYDRQDGGVLKPLANKNIDTGMGLERLTCVLQGKKSNFEIDILEPINQHILKLLGVKSLPDSGKKSLYSITDHMRAATFCIGDGVIPSNEGRGYVVRKLIRLALWHFTALRNYQVPEKPCLYNLVATIGDAMKKPYPEISEAKSSIESTIREEETRFLNTLWTGTNILNKHLANPAIVKSGTLSGEIVFELYDTYGFPDDLTRIIAEQEKGLKIDQAGFDRLMDAQRKRAKDASQIASSIFATTDLEKKIANLPPTKFVGYDALESKSKVLFVESDQKQAAIVFDQSPLYAESGGQVGDHGYLEGKSITGHIVDTQKKDQIFIHYVAIDQGTIKVGDEVTVRVDKDRRFRSMRNHTATHLLHAALRKILGDQVRQLGSLVSPEKLRFDYSYSKPLTAEQIKEIEDSVNAEILKDTDVSKEEKPIEEAKKDGAIAFFGEKYGSRVRVVTVPGYSKEFCGGTHCNRTGQIGFFVITSDASIASGTRRIEALTGEGAIEYVRGLRHQISEVANQLKAQPNEISTRVSKLQETIKRMEKDRKSGSAVKVDPKTVLENALQVGSYRLIMQREKNLPLEDLRALSDLLHNGGSKLIYMLTSENGEKYQILLGMSADLKKSNLDLRDMWKKISTLLQASGGGRKDFIQGGGIMSDDFSAKWEQALDQSKNYLKSV